MNIEAVKILDILKENINNQGEVILNNIFLTLFEEQVGLFYRRKYNINKESTVTGITIEKLINKNYNYSSFQFGEKELELSVITGNTTIKNIIICLDIKIFWNIAESGFVFPENTIIISLTPLSDKQELLNDVHYYKNLLINITKHKYVPYIEMIEKDAIDKNKTELPKIKHSDKLIKFYNFQKGDICKIINKKNIINNKELYINYKVVI